MSADNSKENELDQEDQCQLYSSAGYSATEPSFDDEIDSQTSQEEEIWFDGDDFDMDGKTANWDAPPCPAPLGIAHIVRIGACDFCIGRIGGSMTDVSNVEKGSSLRSDAYERDQELSTNIVQDFCPLCENLFDDIENIVERVSDSLSETKFSTIQFGIHLPKDLIQEEDRIRNRFGAPASYPLKGALVVEIHKLMKEQNKDIVFVKEKPDVMVLVDGLTLRVDIDVRPIFLYGRYRKLSREIPQTRWPCRSCRGRGGNCQSCEGSGMQYLDSVQDLIGEPLRAALIGEDTSFHGMGREDIDVRCLGRGRPFVIEIKKPTYRDYNLSELVKMVNDNGSEKVEIDELSWCTRSMVNKVKETRSEKTYTIRFKVAEVGDEETSKEAIYGLSGKIIDQETPKRVSHRRAAKVRRRKVNSVDQVTIEGDEIQITIRCEAGTYVKELVHSDEGRTSPSIKSALDTECEVIWLDVEEIHAD